MSDQDSNLVPSGDSSGVEESIQTKARTPSFRLRNVLTIIVPIIILGVIVVLFVGYFDGINQVAKAFAPPLVPASGLITFGDQPLNDAQITTQHANGKLKGSIGWTDENGKFTLQTDVDGYVDGAYAGEHLVTVTAVEVINAPTSPPLITPEIYASFDTTPIRINLSRSGGNHFALTLEGEAPPKRQFGQGSGRPQPGAIVDSVFNRYDTNDDEKLTSEELEVVEPDQANRILEADLNEDGTVEREELVNAMNNEPERQDE